MDQFDNLIIETDFDDSTEVMSEDIRLFDFNTALAEELITINIDNAFENKDLNNQSTNYINILQEKYNEALAAEDCSFDREIINGIVFRITNNFLHKLNEHFGVTLGNDIENSDIDEYLTKLSNLYEFFICRRFENVSDYLIRKVFKHKDDLFENYKNKLTPKDASDIFYNINKKKYKSANDAAFLYFIDDIIADIVTESTDAYVMFKYIAEIDVYETTNNAIYNMLESNGYDINYPEGVEVAAKKYLSLLDNKQTYTELRNNLFLYYAEQTSVKNDSDVIFSKDSITNTVTDNTNGEDNAFIRQE